MNLFAYFLKIHLSLHYENRYYKFTFLIKQNFIKYFFALEILVCFIPQHLCLSYANSSRTQLIFFFLSLLHSVGGNNYQSD